ncbi:hypothetical protein CLV63_11075 [Murinocardiopsis flavida]|uniref:Uncharacterized protein n=1 Tax=Murinocardiopsis flavida TaxID=645275 RepID=A0A2P8DHU3_9ACTN|nr:hypothetical protein CLV63_11075 [Murinocardiopsis flavida]
MRTRTTLGAIVRGQGRPRGKSARKREHPGASAPGSTGIRERARPRGESAWESWRPGARPSQRRERLGELASRGEGVLDPREQEPGCREACAAATADTHPARCSPGPAPHGIHRNHARTPSPPHHRSAPAARSVRGGAWRRSLGSASAVAAAQAFRQPCPGPLWARTLSAPTPGTESGSRPTPHGTESGSRPTPHGSAAQSSSPAQSTAARETLGTHLPTPGRGRDRRLIPAPVRTGWAPGAAARWGWATSGPHRWAPRCDRRPQTRAPATPPASNRVRATPSGR